MSNRTAQLKALAATIDNALNLSDAILNELANAQVLCEALDISDALSDVKAKAKELDKAIGWADYTLFGQADE